MASRIVAALMAEGVALDALSGRLTAFNMLETVSAAKYPALLPRLCAVIFYEAASSDPEVFQERVRLMGPEDVEVGVPSSREVVIAARVHRSIHVLAGLRLERPGEYVLSIERKQDADGTWKRTAERRLFVHEQQAAAAAT